MNATTDQHLLIVNSVTAHHEGLEELLTLLAEQPEIDPFIARQRFIGRGPNLLAKGSREKLEPIAGLIAQRNFSCWLIRQNPPLQIPKRLQGLRIDSGSITLLTAKGEFSLGQADRVLGVLADLSGAAIGKHLRHYMVQKVYNGIEGAPPLADEELYEAILRGKPILDLHLFDNQDKVRAVVRVQPGRFDPNGLGERKELSARGNLEQVLKLTREHAGSFTLSLDFGLVNLPGCTLQQEIDGPQWQRNNLESVSCFGSLLAEMTARGVFPVTSAANPAAAGHNLGDLEYLGNVLNAFRGEESPLTQAPPESSAPTLALPPPPEPDRTGKKLPVRIWSILGGGISLSFFLFSENEAFWQFVYLYTIRPGILPAILAIACLWGGFRFLLLKRRVENTPTSRIRSLAMGLVEVHGLTRRKFALVSPMSHLPCVYYRLRRYRRDRRNKWRLSHASDSRHVPFYLKDDTGEITVDPRGAAVKPRLRQTGYGSPSELFFSSSAGLDRDEKWIEDVIPEGTRLYILGQAKEIGQGRPPLREQLLQALRELKRNPQAMKVHDTDGDGIISEAEWGEARRKVEERLLRQNLSDQEPVVPRHDRVAIGRPGNRSLPFIVAETASEAHLTRRYGLYALPLFGAALLATVWMLVMLTRYLQVV